MPLKVTIEMAGYYGPEKKIREFYIGRDELMKKGKEADYPYSVSPQVWPWEPLVSFEHNYKDGAEVCVRKALEAMETLPTEEKFDNKD